MKKRRKKPQVVVADRKMLEKCVKLLKKDNGNGSQKEVIDILEKEVRDINQAGKN